MTNRRFTGRRGMRWWRKNADALAGLRVLYLNGDWDQYLSDSPSYDQTYDQAHPCL